MWDALLLRLVLQTRAILIVFAKDSFARRTCYFLPNCNRNHTITYILHIQMIKIFFSRFYRLNPQREFGNIFSVNNGCPYLQAGIGNIEFVKDLLTQSVLTNNFKCSKFGPHTHQMLGWVYSSFFTQSDSLDIM